MLPQQAKSGGTRCVAGLSEDSIKGPYFLLDGSLPSFSSFFSPCFCSRALIAAVSSVRVRLFVWAF